MIGEAGQRQQGRTGPGPHKAFLSPEHDLVYSGSMSVRNLYIPSATHTSCALDFALRPPIMTGAQPCSADSAQDANDVSGQAACMASLSLRNAWEQSRRSVLGNALCYWVLLHHLHAQLSELGNTLCYQVSLAKLLRYHEPSCMHSLRVWAVVSAPCPMHRLDLHTHGQDSGPQWVHLPWAGQELGEAERVCAAVLQHPRPPQRLFPFHLLSQDPAVQVTL